MFDFTSLTHMHEAIFKNVFGDNTDNLIQIDTHKYVMPIDYNGMIHYVELDFVAKKDDFDAQKAEHDYQVKLQKSLEKEIEQESKKKDSKKKTE